VGVYRRMVAEPKFHQCHKNLTACEVGAIEKVGLLFPFPAKLSAHLLEKAGEYIKFLLALIEEIKL
jgi:hypothetical protein